MKKIMILVIGLCLFITGCKGEALTNKEEEGVVTSQSEDTGEKNPLSGVDLSSLSFEDYEGNEITSEIFKDKKLTVMNLWATWCGPCVDEMPDFEKVWQAVKGQDVQFLGLALDSDDESVKALKDQLNITYPLLRENDDSKALISSKFDYVPVTVFINSEGKVLETFIPGGTDEETLTKTIEALINE